MGNSGTASPGRPLSGGAALWPWGGGSEGVEEKLAWAGSQGRDCGSSHVPRAPREEGVR